MSRSNPNKPNGPKRIDVSSPAKGLTQNPFAELARVTAAAFPAQTAPKTETEPKSKSRGRLLLRRETKHRGGKTVTVVTNFVGIGLPEKEALARVMQKACGVGGTVKEGRIEIQGDKRPEVVRILTEAGFRAVLAGG